MEPSLPLNSTTEVEVGGALKDAGGLIGNLSLEQAIS